MSGLSFDLLGLAPGPPVNLPRGIQTIGYADGLNPQKKEPLALVPGPHIADDASSLPIVRAWLHLACDLAGSLGGVEAVCWGPARLVTPASTFLAGVRGWLSGGPFPALSLIALEWTSDSEVRSNGLKYFIGQEVQLDASLSKDRIGAAKIVARLAHILIGHGRLQDVRQFDLGDAGNFVLTPSQADIVIEVCGM